MTGTYIYHLVLVFHVLIGAGVIGLVLLQHGKGADMGAAFGGGSSGSLFGATGSANFLSRSTAVLAAIFFITSLSLSYMASARPASSSSSVMDNAKVEQTAPTDAAAPATQTTPDAPNSKAKDIPR